MLPVQSQPKIKKRLTGDYRHALLICRIIIYFIYYKKGGAGIKLVMSLLFGVIEFTSKFFVVSEVFG